MAHYTVYGVKEIPRPGFPAHTRAHYVVASTSEEDAAQALGLTVEDLRARFTSNIHQSTIDLALSELDIVFSVQYGAEIHHRRLGVSPFDQHPLDSVEHPHGQQKTVTVIAVGKRGRHLHGGNPYRYIAYSRQITDDFSSNQNKLIIGAAMADAVEHAWSAGYDPTTISFKVRFE